jgi:hypothetical protein
MDHRLARLFRRQSELAAVTMLSPSREESMELGGLVLAIVTDEETGLTAVHRTHNLITDAGDIYYAQLGAEEAATNAFDSMSLGTAASGAPAKGNDSDDFTEIASTNKLVKATYPLTNDTGDADNTGDGPDVVTWTFEWATGDFNSAVITDGCILVGALGAAEPLLTHFEFSGGVFEKTATDTLKVIVNHTFDGV